MYDWYIQLRSTWAAPYRYDTLRCHPPTFLTSFQPRIFQIIRDVKVIFHKTLKAKVSIDFHQIIFKYNLDSKLFLAYAQGIL